MEFTDMFNRKVGKNKEKHSMVAIASDTFYIKRKIKTFHKHFTCSFSRFLPRDCYTCHLVVNWFDVN